jgi:hypothetical protein
LRYFFFILCGQTPLLWPNRVKAQKSCPEVRRNLERFEGEDFMFEVTRDELLRCHIGTLNKVTHQSQDTL